MVKFHSFIQFQVDLLSCPIVPWHEYAKCTMGRSCPIIPCTWICEMYMGRSLHIYIEHRVSKFEKHVTTSLFWHETFYYLWVKGFDIRREAQSFYSDFFICPQHVRHPPQMVSASKRKSTVSFGVQFSTLWLFSKSPQILHALPVRDVTRTM